MAQCNFGIVVSWISFIGSIFTLILGGIFLVLVIEDTVGDLNWDSCDWLVDENHNRRLLSSYGEVYATNFASSDPAALPTVREGERDRVESDVHFASSDFGALPEAMDSERDNVESGVNKATEGRRLHDCHGHGKGKGQGHEHKDCRHYDDDDDDEDGWLHDSSYDPWYGYSNYGEGRAEDCNRHWRNVFSFVPGIFLVLWAPVIMGILGMAVHLAQLRVNWLVEWIVPQGYIGYGVLMLITGLCANIGYCGKIGVLLGFYNLLASLLCFIARCTGEMGIAIVGNGAK